MAESDHADHIRRLEAENARLRRLLDQHGVPSTLRHQTRNALGLMRAILRRSAEGKTSVEDFAAHVEGRFDALLRVQTALLSSHDGCVDLTMLVSDELLAQTIGENERATLDGPTVRLDARQAELLGLALHELATNSLKFGAMTTATGRIDVSWRIDASPARLILVWAETGGRRGTDIPVAKGFGMDTIETMLPYQLKAESTVELLSEGLRCTITVPLAQG
jgi:two-component sensor histidine kinase